jgi:two-component system sensor histidine kinase/response regulator
MTRMVEDMLDLTRAGLAGGIPLNRTKADLAAVVDRVVQELRSAHPARPIDVTIDGDVTGEWDIDRLQQIASNLIANAIQHGDKDCAVAVRLSGVSPDAIAFSVANPGVIPADVLPGIFDPFRSGRDGQMDGLGLGLYIARQIAVAHDGDIAVESTPAVGTTFTVTLPRRMVTFVRI